MKKLFSVKDGRCFHVVEEGKVYAFYDYSQKEWQFYDASGRHLPAHQETDREESVDEEQYTDDKTQITPLINGFYGYSTGEILYHPDGFDGHVGIKDKTGKKITEEIFAELTYFSDGLCPVRNKAGKWGCVDEAGRIVLPYEFSEAPQFNRYGVAVGDHTLIDCDGKEIAGTELNSVDDCHEENRYYTFGLLSASQMESISQCGVAEDVRCDVYDTKLRKYAAKGIPECKLNIGSFDGESEVITAAAEMLNDFDEIWVEAKGTICAKKSGYITIFDFYGS